MGCRHWTGRRGGAVDGRRTGRFDPWWAVFATSAGVALVAWLLLARVRLGDGHPRREPVLFMPALALTCLLGSFAYVLIQGPSTGWRPPSMLAGVLLMLPAAMILLRTSQRHQLLPQELLCAKNCVAGNSATFSLYFGVFGLSFLLVLYTKQTLGYSGIWSAVGVLPVSLAMLVLAETLGTAATRYGTRPTVMLGSIIAAAGVCGSRRHRTRCPSGRASSSAARSSASARA